MPRPPLVYRCAAPLSLGVTLLLFAQWPLRELAGGGAVQANDAAQVLFALYVAVAVGWASRRGAHLAAAPEARQGSRWRRIGAALAPLPWCGWVIATGAAPTWRSVRQLEAFPESYSAGYFLIRIAAFALAVLLAAQSLQAWRAVRR